MRFRLTREMQIPKGAVKVADKMSDAVAYLYVSSQNGKPAAVMFAGKSDKPYFRHWYPTEKQRATAIEQAFKNRQAYLTSKKATREARKAWAPTYQVGDIFGTCWGYEQTNREYFEIIEIKGKFAVLREIAQERTSDGWERGMCVPLPGQYVGEPIRRKMSEHGIKIDDVRWASHKPGQMIAGVRVFEANSWTSYH
jgi:hypothetical protein